jgi:predicted phage gp36 major capsid-like protein
MAPEQQDPKDKQKKKQDPVLKELRGKRAYILQRAPLLRAEIKSLTDEKKKLGAEAKAGNRPKDPKAHKVRFERVSYIKYHVEKLKEELKAVQEEKNSVLSEIKKLAPARPK